MKIKVFNDYNTLCENVANRIIEVITHKPNAVICLPSGDTPLGVFKKLTEHNPTIFKDITLIGLDEWIGMDKDDEGSCQYYIHEYFVKPLHIQNIVEFNAKSNNLEEECTKMNKAIDEVGGIDFMLLGLGMNGHLGLNEPGVDFNNKSHIVQLEGLTKNVAQKYFNQEVTLSKGITLGIKNILESKEVVLMVSGEHKKDIVKKVIQQETTNNIPATILKNHPNSYLYLDNNTLN